MAIETSQQHHEIKAHEDTISFCGYLDQSTVVTSSYDKTIALWDCTHYELKQKLSGHDQRIVACALDKANRKLLSGSWDKTILYWEVETGKSLWCGKHVSQVTSCDLHQESGTAVSGCDSGQVIFWDTRTTSQTGTLKGETSTVSSCKISHDGQKLCSTSLDNTVCIWDIRTNLCLLKLTDHCNSVTSCAFTKTDSHLATTSWDKTIRIYDIATGTYRSRGPVVLQHNGCVSCCCFSSDDELLLTSGFDKTVNLWDMNLCNIKKCFKGHSSWIYWCNFSPSNNWFITGSKEGVLGFWNRESDFTVDQGDELWSGISRRDSNQYKCFRCGLACPKENGSSQDIVICVFCRLKRT